MDNNEITLRADGTVSMYTGKDAVNVFRARVLASSIRLFAKTGLKPTRGVSGRAMLDMATTYSGKKYKRGEYERAAQDVDTWTATMIAALPITQEGQKTS